MKAAALDLVIVNAHVATMTGEQPYGAIREGAVGVKEDRIAWIGSMRDLTPGAGDVQTLDAGGRWLTPGLVDCHTHLVYAGNRVNEFVARQEGSTYEQIAKAGGGIAATVRETRAASCDDLVAQSLPRLVALAKEGVTTVEIKSGYGLDTANERKILKAARSLATAVGVDVRTTLLAAHAVPAEFAGRTDDYVDLVCSEMIPIAARERLADAVDAFCERIAFTPAQTRRVFEAARAHRLPVKLHADQLSDTGGAALAAEFGALSADHLEYTNEAGVGAIARAGSVAVMLPGAFHVLRETRLPPIAALRAQQVPMAVATDCNPGTSPVVSLVLMLNFACTLFGLTPEEALAGVTKNAARALGLRDRGTIALGQRADLALWDIAEPAELAYVIGGSPCAGIIRAGAVVRWADR
jgi:imidazolonepropionase